MLQLAHDVPSMPTARPITEMSDVPLSVFEYLEARLTCSPKADRAPLHQGKTTYPPSVGPVLDDADFDLAPHEHAPTSGSRQLRTLIAERQSAQWGRPVDPERVIITCGATHAISIALRSVLCPDDEVMVLSPQWLFARGLVRMHHGRCVEVPLFVDLASDPEMDVAGRLERFVSSRTKALYFNSPNNPTGVRLDRRRLEELVGFAERHGLWVISDNAYENFDYSSEGFCDAAVIDDQIAFAVHTCSKTHAMPGYRVGWIVAPDDVVDNVHKASLHSTYAVSSHSQAAAATALTRPIQWLDARRERARGARYITHQQLAVPHTRVAGGLYTFLDLRALHQGTATFIDRCLDAGVSLAPGEVFGASYPDWARLCFTAVDEQTLSSALDRINGIYAGMVSA